MMVAALVLVMALQSVDSLIEQLHSPRAEDRDRAQKALILREGDDALPALERAARDPDVELAARATAILAALAPLRSLTPNLGRAVPGAREKLARGEKHLWTELLLDAAAQEGTTRRHPDIRREDLLPLAALALQGAEPAEEVAVCAVIGAWRLNTAVPELLRLVLGRGSGSPYAAAEALVACRDRSAGPDLLAKARSLPAEQRDYWIGVAARLGCREAIPDILARLSAGLPLQYVDLLGCLRDLEAMEAIPVLVKGLKTSAADTRFFDVLWDLSPLDATETLQGLLESPQPYARTAAVRLLGQRPSTTFLPLLVPLLRSDDSALRAGALRALDRLPCGGAQPEIFRLLDDPSTEVRRLAARLLLRLGDKEGLPELMMMLQDPAVSPQECFAAASVLGRPGIPALRALLPREELRGQPFRALVELRAIEAAEDFRKLISHPNAYCRAQAAWGLGMLEGAKAVPDLLPLLKDPDLDVVGTAWTMLAQVDPEGKGRELREKAKRGTPQEREFARQAIGRLRVAVSTEDLQRELDSVDPGRLLAAALSLVPLDPKKALPRLRVLLTDLDEVRRRQAAIGLTALGDRAGLGEFTTPQAETQGFYLNALRSPAAWAAWRARMLTGPPIHGAVRPALEKLAKEMNVRLEGGDLLWAPVPMDIPVDGRSALYVLSQTGGTFGVVLEADVLRVLPIPEFRRFWQRWYTEELLKSDREEDRAGGHLRRSQEEIVDRLRADREARSQAAPVPLPAAVAAIPKIAARLARGSDAVWTEVLLDVLHRKTDIPEYKALTKEDLNSLIVRALKGAVSPEEKTSLLWAVIQHRLTAARPVLPSIIDGPDQRARVLAARALLVLEGARGLGSVEKLLIDPNPSVRTGITQTIGELKLKEALPRILPLKDDPAIREGLAWSGAQLGVPETVTYLFDLLNTSQPEYQNRLFVLLRLSGLAGPEWNGALIEHLKKETDPQCAGHVMRILAQNGGTEGLPAMDATLNRFQQGFRSMALPEYFQALRRLHAPQAGVVLLKHLEPEHFQPAAVDVAGEMDLREALPALRKLLNGTEKHLKAKAAEGLGLLRDRDSEFILRGLLQDPDKSLQAIAAKSLAQMGDRKSFQRIVDICREASYPNDPLGTLLCYPPAAVKDALLENFSKYEYTILPYAVYEALGDDFIPILEKHLVGAERVGVRVHHLGRLGTPAALEKVRPFLDVGDEYAKSMAALALCENGDRDAARRIVSELFGPLAFIPPLELNAVLNPLQWKRLKELKVPVGGFSSSRQHCERLAAAAGLELAGLPPTSPDFPAWAQSWLRLAERGGSLTVLDALEQLRHPRWMPVLEGNRIRILGHAEALEYWRAELAKEKR